MVVEKEDLSLSLTGGQVVKGGACSPNSTISSSSGKRSSGEAYGDVDRACSRGTSDEDEDDTDDTVCRNKSGSNKKLRLSKDQAAVLEQTFKDHNTLNPKQKTSLAKRLGLRARQVEVWFQNRRARTKLKQTEVDCEYLKRCFETLTDQNRRLEKEVQQLRALKFSPQMYMQLSLSPTTLTVCPSCNRTVGPPRTVVPFGARPWGPARFQRAGS
ncbi:Homeobox-leucine zipper protein HAT1 [Striga hermonthica]|uniref:Homeobox-leucine zipper protein HAT1 n=1 Tax=Striga hermonthica TaxID=68872 RepID=A0A9N7NBV1_STRHE|nr:Homeobox-leucine zipper protein HAT1 [Striga hermonthica]